MIDDTEHGQVEASNEDFFQIFGHISVFFATLDTFVTIAILRLVDKNERVKAVAMDDRTTLQRKFRVIQELKPHQVIDSNILLELQKIIPNALVVGERRNRFIHDQWLFSPKHIRGGKIYRIRVKELDKWQFKTEVEEEITLQNLYDFLSEVGELQQRFGAIVEKLPFS